MCSSRQARASGSGTGRSGKRRLRRVDADQAWASLRCRLQPTGAHQAWKLRPALVMQSNLVNEAGYPSTIVIPTTSKLVEDPGILRFRLHRGTGALDRDSELLLGQLIAVANESFCKELGSLPEGTVEEVERRIRIILGL
ncbi:MAG TPA: type II toxin-antitoxin system PemK/MazF family toxin [Nitrospira sp.]|nr:type II toxin-antitoxin system PemK/MazF family toxin [Nitrospira sp.]